MMRTSRTLRIATSGVAASSQGVYDLPPLRRRRVVVTGVGAVTPLGHSVPQLWSALVKPKADGGCRTAAIPLKEFASIPSNDFAPPGCTTTIDALIDALPAKYVTGVAPLPVKGAKKPTDAFASSSRESRYTRFAHFAAAEAIAQAGWITSSSTTSDAPSSSDSATIAAAKSTIPGDRVATVIGACMPSLNDVADVALSLYRPQGPTPQMNKISPFFVPKILANLVGGTVAIKYGYRGPSLASSTACATGAHCIGEAYQLISRGDCDYALAGATEACISPLGLAGFARMKALSTGFAASPGEASRPFDERRDGFVMGEGCGLVAIEAMETAVARGAKILCEIVGYSATADAHHITAPRPGGESVTRCVREALAAAGLEDHDISYVNAHATSTPLGDEIELDALVASLAGGAAGRRDAPLLVSSTKGHMGHLLGAAGSVEAIVAIEALRNGLAPPTANLETPVANAAVQDKRVELVANAPVALVKGPRRSSPITMSTSFGFGGTNACLIFAPAAQ